jgi:hypothetical protein
MAPVRLATSFLLCLTTALVACNTAQLRPAPDAAPSCAGASILEYPCAAQAAGTPGCAGDLNSQAALGKDVSLPGASYPVGCAVIVNASSTDQDEQCSQIGTCHCDEADGGGDGGTYSWFCSQ